MKEEDFVTNLYDRDLLSGIDGGSIGLLIEEAIEHIDYLQNIKFDCRLVAINRRLDLRYMMLCATMDDNIVDVKKVYEWLACRDVTDFIAQSHSLSVPVPESYSQKLQRKLATTMPPKPLIEITFDEAMKELDLLILNSMEAFYVLQYAGPENLMVSTIDDLVRHHLINIRSRILCDCSILGVLNRLSIHGLSCKH